MEFSPERIFLNMVMTLDGKITTRDGAGSKFASQADQERMLQIRSEADAIIIGAGTAIADNPTFDDLHKVAEIHVVGKSEVDFTRIVEILTKEYDVKQLLIEGGGQVNFVAFKAGIVNEVFLTLSPKIAGGNIQTMVEGTGFDFDSLVELELLNFQTVASEVFLHYRVIKKTDTD
jgi:riboflavin biosynthesis pyrimidine reductase